MLYTYKMIPIGIKHTLENAPSFQDWEVLARHICGIKDETVIKDMWQRRQDYLALKEKAFSKIGKLQYVQELNLYKNADGQAFLVQPINESRFKLLTINELETIIGSLRDFINTLQDSDVESLNAFYATHRYYFLTQEEQTYWDERESENQWYDS